MNKKIIELSTVNKVKLYKRKILTHNEMDYALVDLSLFRTF